VLTSKLPGGQALLGLVPILLKMNDKGGPPLAYAVVPVMFVIERTLLVRSTEQGALVTTPPDNGLESRHVPDPVLTRGSRSVIPLSSVGNVIFIILLG
jgi:hypothetical protein